MAAVDLKKYLEQVVELEKVVYIQDRTLYSLNNRINSLCIKSEEFIPKKESAYLGDIGSAIWSFIGAVIALILGVKCFSKASSCIFMFIEGIVMTFGILLITGSIALIIFGIKCIMEYFGDVKRYKNKYDSDVKYARDLSVYEKKRMISEGIEKNNLTKDRDLLRKKHNDTKALLDSLYRLNIIYPKYRNFVAVCSFYEYIKSGRCRELEGHEGAYNIFENEIRLDLIILKLDDVIKNLEQIKQNQYMLHAAITEGNRKINSLVQKSIQLSSQMDGISRQSAIAAQNTAWAAQELNTIKWIEMIRR